MRRVFVQLEKVRDAIPPWGCAPDELCTKAKPLPLQRSDLKTSFHGSTAPFEALAKPDCRQTYPQTIEEDHFEHVKLGSWLQREEPAAAAVLVR